MLDTNGYDELNLQIIVNKRLKHSYINIDRDKNIIVKTPHKSRLFVDSLLKEKRSWIQKQFKKIDQCVTIENKELHSKEFIINRVEHYSNLMDLDFSALKFRKMRARWGSCSSKREITLNSELSRLSENLIDYVVVHELAHLRHMNHSKEFHSLVDSYLADSKAHRKELKKIRLT